jgi:hypothetical protein
MEGVIETEMDGNDLEGMGEAEGSTIESGGETVMDPDYKLEYRKDFVEVENGYYPIWVYLGPAWIELIVGIIQSHYYSLGLSISCS